MEFLVELTTSLPSAWDTATREQLVRRETERGRQLVAAGVIDRIWRLPGQQANVGIWTAESAQALHEAITSLPAWPWMSVRVSVLARHPLDA